MTNTYETIIILDPSNYKDSVKVFRDMCQEFTKEYKIKEDYLGVKKLEIHRRILCKVRLDGNFRKRS